MADTKTSAETNNITAWTTDTWFAAIEAQSTTPVDGYITAEQFDVRFSPLAGSASITTLGTISTGTWSATDVAVAAGGTGASTAGGARTNLGLVIGTNVQAFGAILDDLNTLGANAADSEFLVGTAAGALAWETGATARTSIGLGNVEDTALSTWAGSASITTLGTISTGTWSATDVAVAAGGTGASTAGDARTNLGLVIGTNIQAFGAVLDDLNTLGANAADSEFLVGTGVGALAWESGATARTSLGVDAAGTDNSTDVTLVGAGTYLSLAGQAITVDLITESDITDLGSYAVIGGAHHDGFSDFVGNEHIDHTSVTLTAGTGLTGGGDISANRSFAVDGVLEDLDTLGPNAADSEFLVGTGVGALAWESGATALTSLGAVALAGDTMTGALTVDVSSTTALQVETGGNNALVVDTANGRLGIGTTPTFGLDIVGGGSGEIRSTHVTTDATIKRARFLTRHYTNAEEDFILFSGVAGSGSNLVDFGGGSSIFNTATEINFYTAVSTTTLTGTKAMNINLGQNTTFFGRVNIDIGSTSAGKPCLVLEQRDVDEDYMQFLGTSDTSADRALVDAANFTTPGSIAGWLKIKITDDQGTGPITDGDYYLPFYTVPTA